jgi:hypothetical protein
VQPVAPSVAESVGRVSTVRVNVRDWAEAALHRLQSSDLAMGIHAASTGGGGRISSIAALIGICVSGVGAGTYCVATALLPDPKPVIRREAKPPKRKATHANSPASTANASVSPQAERAQLPRARPTPGPAATPTSPRSARAGKPTPPGEFSFETNSARASTRPPAGTASTTPSASPASGSFESGNATTTTSGHSEFSDSAGGEFSP